jgi:hypothetical protein
MSSTAAELEAAYAIDLLRTGRLELLEEIARLKKLNAQLNDNLSSVQARCTELLEQVRTFTACGYVSVKPAAETPTPAPAPGSGPPDRSCQ